MLYRRVRGDWRERRLQHGVAAAGLRRGGKRIKQGLTSQPYQAAVADRIQTVPVAFVDGTYSVSRPADRNTKEAQPDAEGRIDIDAPFLIPTSFTLQVRGSDPVRFEIRHEGRGLRHQTDEVARCLAAGLIESPVMSHDETIAIMETMDSVLANGSWRRPAERLETSAA